MNMLPASTWGDKLRAAGIHFALCMAVAVLAGVVVFELWYPAPYGEISGGRSLFMLVVSVDVVLGPLVTAVVFNRRKPRRELRRDLGVIVAIQLAALGYGLWTVFIARPVHLVFEYDRFRVVHALEVAPQELGQAPAGVDALPLGGPSLLSLRPFKDEQEKLDYTLAALQGVALSARPGLWQTYQAGRAQILRQALPVAKLKQRLPTQTGEIDRAAQAAGRQADELVYLPMIGRKTYWTVLLDPATALPLAFLPLDSF